MQYGVAAAHNKDPSEKVPSGCPGPHPRPASRARRRSPKDAVPVTEDTEAGLAVRNYERERGEVDKAVRKGEGFLRVLSAPLLLLAQDDL
eukprot:8513458-Pyramimonas_sp.AAC.1